MLNVVFNDDGAPINETAVCDYHMPDFGDMAYGNAEDAEDSPEEVIFSEVTAEFAANNDTVCIGCNAERQIAEEDISPHP